ncbi:hypothetical protein Tco_1486119 [Tanacetum coccineum]
MKKLKENGHAIQVRCQTCKGAHLDKECPLNEEVKSMEEVKYGEFGRTFPNNNRNDGRFNRGISRYDSHDLPSSVERRPSLAEIINKYMNEVAKRHAEQDKWLKKFYQNTKTNHENHDKIIQGLETKRKNLVANKPKTEEEDEVRMNPRCSALLQNQLPPKEQDPGNFILLCSIGRPQGMREDKAKATLEIVLDKLDEA